MPRFSRRGGSQDHIESQNDESPQRLRHQSRSRHRRSSSSRHDGHKVYPVTLNDSAPSHSLIPRPHLEQFIVSSFRHCPFSAGRVSRNGGVRTRTERHLKPTPLPNWATFRPAPSATRDQRRKAMTRCRRPVRGVEPVSGWCRIRTCGTSRFTCFQDRRVRPLRQPSMPDFLSGRSGYGPHVHRLHMIHRRVESGGRADWIFTASVEDNGACRMHPLDVPSVQAAKPKSARTRMRLTPTVPKGCSATPMTMDGSSPIHHRAPSRTRTGNTRIRSPLLYPLSYRGSEGSAPGFAPGRAFDPFAAGAHRAHPRRVSCVSLFGCGSAIVCHTLD